MNSLLQKFILATLLVAASFVNSHSASAHSDIFFEYHNGKIEVDFGSEGQVFEADFPTSGLFQKFTSNPGFNTENQPNGVYPGDIFSFNILGPLEYHDGSSFATVPGSAAIEIEDGLNNIIPVDGSTLSTSGIIDQAYDAGGGRGDVHAHAKFTLTPPSLDAPEYGAYGLLMDLATDEPGIANSDPFYIVFNFGLEDSAFEGAVGAFASQIPEPTSLMLLGTAASVCVLTRRRKQ